MRGWWEGGGLPIFWASRCPPARSLGLRLNGYLAIYALPSGSIFGLRSRRVSIPPRSDASHAAYRRVVYSRLAQLLPSPLQAKVVLAMPGPILVRVTQALPDTEQGC